MTDTTNTYYISITGLVPKSSWQAWIQFYYHAIPSSIQAKSAPGNIYANTHYFNGYMMTMTIWENRKAMMSFMFKGAHIQALKIFHDVASSGKTTGYETNSPNPISWQDAYEILMAKGKEHGGNLKKVVNTDAVKIDAHDVAIATTSKSSGGGPFDRYTIICAFALLLCAALVASTKRSDTATAI